MANYRFKTAEIEAMKKNILTHIEREAETKTAWRLRCAIEGQLMCCHPSKRDAARQERELALYEKLTKNDLPNWRSEPTQPATPTETPRISTEASKTVNVSAEGEKAENEPEIIIRRRTISKANNGKMVLFHKRTEWANFWYAYEEDALTLCRACGHDPKTYGLSFIPLSDGSRGYPIMIFTDEFGKPGLSKIPPEILDENCVVVEKDM